MHAGRQGIKRRYLFDEVAENLRDLILSGELLPQSRVNEPELAERFGISRTPLREAIKILAAEGLIDLLPNRGARIANISESEIEEMIEVIAGLEGTAAELACLTISDAEVDAIEKKTSQMNEAWKDNDEPRYFTLNREIHDAIMAASRNTTLQGIYTNLGGRIQRARYSAHKTAEQWRKAVDEHNEMVELLKARRGEELSQLMRKHLRGKKPVIAAAYLERSR